MCTALLFSFFELTRCQFLGFRTTYYCQQSYQTVCNLATQELSVHYPAVSSSMRRRQHLSSNTTLSWQLTSRTVSSSLRGNQPYQRPLRREPDRSINIDKITFLASPQSLLTGMNRFLSSLQITFRRDPTNFRPRVNKLNSVKDREQKCK